MKVVGGAKSIGGTISFFNYTTLSSRFRNPYQGPIGIRYLAMNEQSTLKKEKMTYLVFLEPRHDVRL
jgi:hypothetical protein